MARPQLAVYDGIKIPRTRENEERYLWEKTPCKRFPKYVYGKPGAASLIHKVAYADMRWYNFGYDYLYRLQSPIILAHTVCGMCWRISEAGRSNTCEVPRPDAVLCGRCHGEGVNFPQNRPAKIPMSVAKLRLGCITSM